MVTVEEKTEKLGGLLLQVFIKINTANRMHFAVITDEEMRLVRKAGLLEPYHGFNSLDVSSKEGIDTAELLAIGQRAEGKRVVSSDGKFFYTVEIATIGGVINKLVGYELVVNESQKKHTDEPKPQEQPQKWQEYVTPKYEDAVLLAVRLEPKTREDFHSLMRAKDTTAQEYLARFIADEVKKHPNLVEKGKHMEAAGTKKNYRTKLQILKEENARLREMAQLHTSSPSR